MTASTGVRIWWSRCTAECEWIEAKHYQWNFQLDLAEFCAGSACANSFAQGERHEAQCEFSS
jgi:hypothetical protein